MLSIPLHGVALTLSGPCAESRPGAQKAPTARRAPTVVHPAAVERPQPSAPTCSCRTYQPAVGPTVLSNEPPQIPVASGSSHSHSLRRFVLRWSARPWYPVIPSSTKTRAAVKAFCRHSIYSQLTLNKDYTRQRGGPCPISWWMSEQRRAPPFAPKGGILPADGSIESCLPWQPHQPHCECSAWAEMGESGLGSAGLALHCRGTMPVLGSLGCPDTLSLAGAEKQAVACQVPLASHLPSASGHSKPRMDPSAPGRDDHAFPGKAVRAPS